VLLWRYSRQTDQESAGALDEKIGAALTRSLHPAALESLTIFLRKMIGEETDFRSILSTILLVPLLPFIVMRLAASVIYGLISLFLLSPLVALVLRLRRHQADTAAVHLTGDADGLARASVHLYGSPHALPRTGWSEMNFIVGHEVANAQLLDQFKARVADATNTANNFNRRLQGPKQAVSNSDGVHQPESAAASHNFVFGFHPPLGTRIMRLKKKGAEVAWSQRPDNSSWIIAAVFVVAVSGLVVLAIP
jgi:hypothetical protein